MVKIIDNAAAMHIKFVAITFVFGLCYLRSWEYLSSGMAVSRMSPDLSALLSSLLILFSGRIYHTMIT